MQVDVGPGPPVGAGGGGGGGGAVPVPAASVLAPFSDPTVPSANSLDYEYKQLCAVPDSCVRIGLVNCQSVKEKEHLVADAMQNHEFDILALTETWLSTNDWPSPNSLTMRPYLFYGKHRHCGHRGGGVGFLLSKKFASRVKPIRSRHQHFK
jgi:hypothetical protein